MDNENFIDILYESSLIYTKFENTYTDVTNVEPNICKGKKRKRKVARPIKRFPVSPDDISYDKQIRQNSCIIRDVTSERKSKSDLISNCHYISTHLKVHANDNIICRSVYMYKNRSSAKFKVAGNRNIKLLPSFMTGRTDRRSFMGIDLFSKGHLVKGKWRVSDNPSLGSCNLEIWRTRHSLTN